MKITGLTDKFAEKNQVPIDNVGNNEVLSALGELIALDNNKENNTSKSAEEKKEARMKLETFLVSKILQDRYNVIVKTINFATVQ